MRHFISTALGGLLLTACTSAATPPAAAPVAIDGVYKAEVASAKLSTKPDAFSVKDGQYDCSSCTPPYKIAADGAPHAVAGRDYWDAASVKVVDAATIAFTRYRKGAAVGTTTSVLSADGQTLTSTLTSSDNAAGKAITSVYKAKRSGPAPAGSHAASGTWLAVNEGAQPAEEAITATISMKGGTVMQSFPTGEKYEAKIGGPQVPLVGDKAGTMVAVVAEGTGFKETDYTGGKAVSEYIYTPVDAKTIKMKVNNLKTGTTEEFTLKKQ